MEYRIDKEGLLNRLAIWDGFLHKKVQLIACGGTALTLLNIKPSTKDIDLIVPVWAEYDYLIRILKEIGYKPTTSSGWVRENGFIFELFKGNRVHTTELLESPLEKGYNIPIKEFSYVCLGVLNYYDLVISKMFRGSLLDLEDCLSLIKAKQNELDFNKLILRYKETASYDISEEKVLKNLDYLLDRLKKEGIKI